MKVLVVDDSASVVNLIKNALELKGVKDVDGAYNSREAMEKIQNGDYDVYIFDYHLPVMDGLELAKIVKRRGGEKIIIITGDEGFSSDEFVVFHKPFSVWEILEYLFEG